MGGVIGSELSQSTYATRSTFGHTATSSTGIISGSGGAKDTRPHSSSFLALLNPLRPVSLSKSPTPTNHTSNSTTSSSSQQVIPVDWKLERLKATDEIPQPIPTR